MLRDLDGMRASESTRCLVLGGRGFIGSNLIDALLERGHFVRCFDRPNRVSLSAQHPNHRNFELVEGDFLNSDEVCASLEGCDICYHLLCTTLPQSSNADPCFDIETNLLGTVRILECAGKSGIKKIIFASSGGTVYGVPNQIPIPETHSTDPVCSYGITKLSIEKYLALFHQTRGLDYTVLRLANPFGEGQRIHSSQGAIAVFLGLILRGEPVDIWGDGSIVRDYIHIADVVDALLLAQENSDEHVFNVGSGRGRSINEILDALERVTGLDAKRRYSPGRTFDVPVSVLNIERAKRLLGWSPKVDFEDGLERFVAWLTKHPENAIR